MIMCTLLSYHSVVTVIYTASRYIHDITSI